MYALFKRLSEKRHTSDLHFDTKKCQPIYTHHTVNICYLTCWHYFTLGFSLAQLLVSRGHTLTLLWHTFYPYYATFQPYSSTVYCTVLIALLSSVQYVSTSKYGGRWSKTDASPDMGEMVGICSPPKFGINTHSNAGCSGWEEML